jgi:hypothetical protein
MKATDIRILMAPASAMLVSCPHHATSFFIDGSTLRYDSYYPQQQYRSSLCSSTADSYGGDGVSFSSGTSSYGDWAALGTPPIQYPPATDPNDRNEEYEAASSPGSLSSSECVSQLKDDEVALTSRLYSGQSGGMGSIAKQQATKFVSDGGMMFEEQKAFSVLKRPEEKKISNEASDPLWLGASEKKSIPLVPTRNDSITGTTQGTFLKRDENLMLWDHQTPPTSDDRWREAYLNQSVEVAAVVDESTIVLKPRQPTLLWEQRESDFLPKY